jgi:DNA-binding MarR family transcriptional regulator
MQQDPAKDGPKETLEDALVRTSYHVMGILTRLGAENDLSLTQLRVLGILRDRRGRMSDLAAHLGLDKSTMSGLVDRAERRGLLARDKNPQDGRVVDVFATPAGLELIHRLLMEFRREMAPATERLTPEQRDQLTRLLELFLEKPPAAPVRPARPR